MTIMLTYFVLQCLNFIGSLSLVCGTIHVSISYQLSKIHLTKTIFTEATKTVDCMARLACDSHNFLGHGISSYE